ncbi:hypothetical protein E2562_002571 [Oryza meyeriana var. granulata]|uniref:Uncharacterized protein n=1 Tax=Oryza meyeriana var. granulata TaxID=110450 RepID=A0A6G1F331_9ORYZ|nr:hypothetical protein E2562_002571 [Oryza meyeriana var. granulata]
MRCGGTDLGEGERGVSGTAPIWARVNNGADLARKSRASGHLLCWEQCSGGEAALGTRGLVRRARTQSLSRGSQGEIGVGAECANGDWSSHGCGRKGT